MVRRFYCVSYCLDVLLEAQDVKLSSHLPCNWVFLAFIIQPHFPLYAFYDFYPQPLFNPRLLVSGVALPNFVLAVS